MRKMTLVRSIIAARVLGEMEGSGIEVIANTAGITDLKEINEIIASLNHIDQYDKSSSQNVKQFFSRERTAKEIADLMTGCNWLAYYWYNYQNEENGYKKPFYSYAREAVIYFSDCYNEMYEYLASGKLTDEIVKKVLSIID